MKAGSALKGKRILVMGLGINNGGLSLTKYLAKHGAILTVTDLKKSFELQASLRELTKYKNIKYTLEGHELRDFKNQDLLFQNPGVPNDSPFLRYAQKNQIPITNEAAFFLEHCKAMVIGITGTRGKSTTSALLYALLKESKRRKASRVFLAGNIATTGLSTVLETATKKDIVIAELSSWQLEHLSKLRRSPHIAVITNIYEDHLNRYSSLRSYAAAKANIFRYQKRSDAAVVSADNVLAKELIRYSAAKKYYFSASKSVNGCYITNKTLYYRNGARVRRLFFLDDRIAQTIPFQENLAAAATVATLCGFTANEILKGVRAFKPLDFRMQTIARFKNTTIINDSCSTAPIACIYALQKCAGRPIALIAGGVDKKLSYASLARHIQQLQATTFILPGSASNKLIKELNLLKYHKYYRVKTLLAATQRALALAPDFLLFSPAAASFNQFINEFDRGRAFNRIIHGILEKKK